MTQARLLEIAESYIGFRSRALRTNDFGAKTGHSGQIWSGSFVEICLREAGFKIPASFADTNAGLRYVELRHLKVSQPRPGDLVFYTFSTDGSFSQPHIGIVTDISNWKKTGQFKAIEGEVAPNASRKHPQPADGVWRRTRYATEVQAFARVQDWKAARGTATRSAKALLVSSDFSYLGRGAHVERVQLALGDVFSNRLRGLRKGTWDAATGHAYAEWQRICGVKPTGLPDPKSLSNLALDSGRFTV